MGEPLAVTLTTAELAALVRDAVAEALSERSAPDTCRPEVMTRAEAAAYLRCSLGQLDRLAREGDLPWHRLGDSKRFFRNELATWLQRGGRPNG